MMILAGGHYKQTQSNYIIAALMNIMISIVLVKKFGLIGIAVGTLIAMLYQTVWMAYYVSKHLVHYPFKNLLKQLGVDVLTFVMSIGVIDFVKIEAGTYMEWGISAIKTCLVWFITAIVINMIFYGDNMRYMTGKIMKK